MLTLRHCYFYNQKWRYGKNNLLLLPLLISMSLFLISFHTLFFPISALLLPRIISLLYFEAPYITQIHHRMYVLIRICLFFLLLQGLHNTLIYLIDHLLLSLKQMIYFLIALQSVRLKQTNKTTQTNKQTTTTEKHYSITHEKVISISCLITFANNSLEKETCFSSIISCKLKCAYGCLLD